jgi:polysaccharide biosynthesis/export protein
MTPKKAASTLTRLTIKTLVACLPTNLLPNVSTALLVTLLMTCNANNLALAEQATLPQLTLSSAQQTQQLVALDTATPAAAMPAAVGQPDLKASVSVTDSEYLLGPGDELSMRVLDEPELNQDKILVQPDGLISLPIVGVINANNKTIYELNQIIYQRLSRIINKPESSIALVRPRAGTIYLAGAVLHPGMFQINNNPTQQNGVNATGNEPVTRVDFRVSNILTVAGGVMMNADLTHVEVRRALTNQIDVINLWHVLKGTDTTQDLLLHSGDTIYVPSVDHISLDDEDFQTLLRSPLGPKTFPVRVLGEANQPGIYAIDGTSAMLNTAIAKAGGFAPQAARHVVAIRRFTTANSFTDMFVAPDKMDLLLRPNDIVVIGENNVYKSGRFMTQITAILSPFQSTAVIGSQITQIFGLGGWDRSVPTRVINQTQNNNR